MNTRLHTAEQSEQSARTRYTFHGNSRDTRHGWLRLTPAYSRNLVRELIAASERGDLPVLDPFSGTGTTVLSCAERAVPCSAVELNPFLVWLGRCKIARYSRPQRAAAERALGAMARAAENTAEPRAWVPALHQIEKWWDAPALDALSRAFANLRARRELDARARDLCKLAFCRALIDVAHVSFGHQSMSFKARPAQPSTEPETGAGEHVARSLLGALASLKRAAETELPRTRRSVTRGDARALAAVLPERAFGTVITSPPYANRMSYIRELRPYMYWLGYLADGKSAGELDWQAIGGTWGAATSKLMTWVPERRGALRHASYPSIIRRITAQSPVLGRYVERYFEDMHAHLESLARVVAPRARVHYIVGNSKFYDVVLPVQDLLARLFELNGFEQPEVVQLRKRTSKAELYEYLVSATRCG